MQPASNIPVMATRRLSMAGQRSALSAIRGNTLLGTPALRLRTNCLLRGPGSCLFERRIASAAFRFVEENQ
jgi:hypothetical protein